MILEGTPEQIMSTLIAESRKPLDAAKQAQAAVLLSKRQSYEYQVVALYTLAQRFNRKGAHILELGTEQGMTAIAMSLAAPKAWVLTINPARAELQQSVVILADYHNVIQMAGRSWDWLSLLGPDPDMVFVDGDHRRIALDMPWYNRLKVGGLMLFHDYSPENSKRPCVPVYDALNDMREQLGREFDVLVRDNTGVGMAGFYRREGETWQPTQP